VSRLFVRDNSDRITFPGPGGGYTKLSLSMWVYPVSQPEEGEIYGIVWNGGAAGYTGYSLYYYTVGGVQKLEYLTSLTFLSDTTKTCTVTLTTNAWSHIVFAIDLTTDPDTVGMYVNGVSQSVATSGESTVNALAGGTQKIGCYSASGTDAHFWDGRIGELAVLYHRQSSGAVVYSPFTIAEALALSRGAYLCEMRGDPYEYEGIWMLEGLFDPEPDWSVQRRHSTLITGNPDTSGPVGAANPPTAWYPPLIPSYPLELSSGSGTLDLSLTVLVEPIAAIGIIPAPSCPGYTGDAIRPLEPETGE